MRQESQSEEMMKMLWKRMFGSIQKTIFAVILVLIIVPTAILGVISYRQYRKIITENVRVLNQSNTSQIASNIEGIMKNLQNSSLSFYQNEMVREYLLARDPDEVEQAWYSLNQYVLNQIAYEEYIYAVDFVRLDGRRYSSSSVTEGISGPVKELLMEKSGGPLFRTDIHVADYGDLRSDELYGYARCIHDINDIGIPIGFQQIYFKKQNLKRLLNDYRADGEAYYIVEDGRIIISTDPDQEGKAVSEILPNLKLDEEYSSQQMKVDGTPVMTACARVKYPGWYVVKQISLSQISGETAVVRQLLITSGILAVVLCALAGFFLSRFVIRPLKRLESSMKHIEEDHFKRKLPETGYEELSLLAKAFNRMSARLDELVNQVYLAKIREKDAQIRAMQAYINPHFLYNTLDTICWMSRMEQAGETCRLIEALSKLFRASVKDTGKTTTVAGELEHIRNYIMIQECRHTDSIEFAVEADEDLMGCETVRFVLQPLVENAIVHGLEPTGEPGTIWIRIYREENALIMTVENDGMDADAEELKALMDQYREGLKGMGLSNVNDRIRLCYGEEYGLRFEKRIPKGLIVRVVQPFILEGDRSAG